MGKKIRLDDLFGRWRHTPSDDTESTMTFRKAVADKPSRGGLVLDLTNPSASHLAAVAKDDRHIPESIEWHFDPSTGLLSMTLADGSKEQIKLLSIDGDKLVAAKPA
jgi:hypothetical protein